MEIEEIENLRKRERTFSRKRPTGWDHTLCGGARNFVHQHVSFVVK